jgi:hypothetical protein
MGDMNVQTSLPKPDHLWNVKTNQTFTPYSWHHHQCLCKHFESLSNWFLTVKQNLMHILFMKVWPLQTSTMIAEPIQHKQTNVHCTYTQCTITATPTALTHNKSAQRYVVSGAELHYIRFALHAAIPHTFGVASCTGLLTYLLTPWSRVLLEKPTSKLCS